MTATSNATRRVTGFDLASRRRRIGVTQDAVAAAWGVKRQRVAYLEALRRPTRDAATRYLSILESLRGEW